MPTEHLHDSDLWFPESRRARRSPLSGDSGLDLAALVLSVRGKAHSPLGFVRAVERSWGMPASVLEGVAYEMCGMMIGAS